MQERQIPVCAVMSGPVGCGELSKVLLEVAKETGIFKGHEILAKMGLSEVPFHYEPKVVILREITYHIICKDVVVGTGEGIKCKKADGKCEDIKAEKEDRVMKGVRLIYEME
jgi:hypothetical protein